jgi:ABC-2 type transport system permease protein
LKIIFKIFKREFFLLKKRPSAWILTLAIPIIIFTYLGAIYFQGTIDHVEIGVLDHDNSKLSQKIIQQLKASPKLKIIKYLDSEDVIDRVFIDNPDIKGFYYFPKDFSKNIFLGSQEKIIVYTNSSNIVYGNLIYKEAATLINTISTGINLNRLKIKGIPQNKAMNMVMPIRVISKPLYNPYYNYLQYLLPGLTTVLLQMIVFLLAARSINSEISNNRIAELFNIAKGSILKIVLGKLLLYTLIGFSIGLVTLVFFHPFMGIPFSNSTLSFLPVVFIFVMTNAMLGMMVSSMFDKEAIAMDMSFVYNSPAFVFSGFTFPIMAMPAFDAWYAQLIPYTHFLKAYTKWVDMEVPHHFSFNHIIAILIFFIIGYTITVVLLMLKQKKLVLA